MTGPADDTAPATHRAERLARQAIDLGCAALASGNDTQALAWFERASRLARHDPTAALLLSASLAATDPARSEAILQAASARNPRHRALLTARAASALRRGDPSQAAARLQALLAGGGMPHGTGFLHLARSVAEQSGRAGWIGLSSNGTLRFSASRAVLRLDGTRLSVPDRKPAAPPGAPRTMTLPPGWRRANTLTATAGGEPLIGSPIDIALVIRVEGHVTAQDATAISGWAWHPNDPETPVHLDLVAGHGSLPLASLTAQHPVADQAWTTDRGTTDGGTIEAGAHEEIFVEEPWSEAPAGDAGSGDHGHDPAAPRLGFAFDLTGIEQAAGSLQVRAMDGRMLPGIPRLPLPELHAARRAAAALGRRATGPDSWCPIPASLAALAPPPARPAAAQPAAAPEAPASQGRRDKSPGGFDVILALRGNPGRLSACLRSLCAAGLHIVAVDDGSAAAGHAALVREAGGDIIQATPARLPALLNAGLSHVLAEGRPARRVLLLGTPCVLPPKLPDRLAAALRGSRDSGIVQPILVPGTNEPADPRRDALYRSGNPGRTEPLTAAAGPCIAIAHACLSETGLLRAEAFAGRDAALADFCMRARHLGWRTLLACDAPLQEPAHPIDGGAGKMRENDQATLERLHPGIGRLLETQRRATPGALAHRNVSAALWRQGRKRRGSVVLVTHAHGGGVERMIRERAAAIEAGRARAIVIRPGVAADGAAVWCVSEGVGDTHPALRFRAPDELGEMAALLQEDGPALVELHHAASHHGEICLLAPRLGIPYDVVVHDFAMICPRVTLVGGAGRYCGEPSAAAECDDCVADHGVRIGERQPVASLRAASRTLFAGARDIIVPAADGARRLRRYFPEVRPRIRPWQDDAALAAGVPRSPRRAPGRQATDPVTVCVAGAIGLDKGYDVLLACARDAARRDLHLTFTVVGHTIDDARLIDTGRVFITGRYEEEEAVRLIRAQRADIGFLPSVWPETWCYALSALWEAGLWTLAFALGAQAERIGATGAGRTLPPGLPAPRLNDIILGLMPPAARRPAALPGPGTAHLSHSPKAGVHG